MFDLSKIFNLLFPTPCLNQKTTVLMNWLIVTIYYRIQFDLFWLIDLLKVLLQNYLFLMG